MDLGGRLREHRRRLGLTTQQVADRSGLSRVSVSQIEANKGNPSLATLRNLSTAVGITLGELFEDEEPVEPPRQAEAAEAPGEPPRAASMTRPAVQIVRRDARKTMTWPGANWTVSLLTPDVQGQLQVTWTFKDPSDLPLDRHTHQGEELGVVIQGSYEVVVGDETFRLEVGDSIYLVGPTPHRLRVVGDQPGQMIWAITPPDF